MIRVSFCLVQRFALADFGRAEILFESRKNPKPEKCFSKPQTPKNPLHALLGGFMPMLFGASANLPTKYLTVIR